MNQDKKSVNNYVTSIIVLLAICYIGFTQRVQYVAPDEKVEVEPVVAIHPIEEVYKIQGRKFADKCVIDTSSDGLRVNKYYKNDIDEVFVDFSDLRLNKRYLVRITSKDMKDRKAEYNMDNGLFINSPDVIGTVIENDKLKNYTCFYVEEYKAKKAEGLIELDNALVGSFEEYIDKKYAQVEEQEEEEASGEAVNEEDKNE